MLFEHFNKWVFAKRLDAMVNVKLGIATVVDLHVFISMHKMRLFNSSVLCVLVKQQRVTTVTVACWCTAAGTYALSVLGGFLHTWHSHWDQHPSSATTVIIRRLLCVTRQLRPGCWSMSENCGLMHWSN